MRSPVITLILAAAALGLAVITGISITEGGLDRLLDGKALPEGARVYHFDPGRVRHIQLTNAGMTARFEFIDNAWTMIEPRQDRMDPRLADELIRFTLSASVEDAIPESRVDTRLVGLKTGNVVVRLADAMGRRLAHYVIGRRTAWFVEDENSESPIPTVFLRPFEQAHGGYVYACTGDPHPIFRDGFERLRDHHPFLFHPPALGSIRIRTSEGELRLAREQNSQPWRIIKPLELPTEADAVHRLITGLHELSATRVTNADEITPPTAESEATNSIEIAIQNFGSEEETTLKITPLADPAARNALATISNREAVFELPLRPEGDGVAVLELPLSVNDLRDKTLTTMDLAALSAIRIDPAGGTTTLAARTRRGHWKIARDGDDEDVNLDALANLLDAVTNGEVAGFVTDTATDFAPYGIDDPFLTLRFLSFRNEGLELRFGRGPDGTIHANRTGSPTVVKVDGSLLSRIATRPYQWKTRLLWRLPRVDVVGLERQLGDSGPLLLKYKFLGESWNASRNNEDLSAKLNRHRANFLLDSLERLEVLRWIGPNNSAAATALLQPALTISVLQRLIDDDGESSGMIRRTLLATPVSNSPDNEFFYGLVDGEPNFFILNRKSFDNLSVDLFED